MRRTDRSVSLLASPRSAASNIMWRVGTEHAIFLVGGDPTFPVFLYGQLRFAQRLPVLIAMAVLLMIGTVALTLLALRLRGRET